LIGWTEADWGGRLSSLSNEKKALGAKNEHLQVLVTSISGCEGFTPELNFMMRTEASKNF
jgi:hypothetical protein